MISEDSFALIEFGLWLANFFCLAPFSFDAKRKQFAIAQNPFWAQWIFGRYSGFIEIWKLVMLWSVIFELSIIIYYGILSLTNVFVPTEEIFFMICTTCLLLFAIMIQHFCLTKIDAGLILCNNYLKFNTKYQKTFKIKSPTHDGMENLIKIMIVHVMTLPALEFLGFFIFFSQDYVMLRFWWWILSFLPGRIYIVTIYVTLMSNVLWCHCLTFVVIAIIIHTFIMGWVQHRNSKAAHGEKWKPAKDIETFYRSLQLLHANTNAVGKFISPATQIIGSLIQCSVAICLIQSHESVNHFTIINFALIGIAALVLFGLEVTTLSKAAQTTMRFQLTHFHTLDPKFRRSCRPLKWLLGIFYHVRRNTYLVIMNNFVLKSIIRVTLTFRKHP